MMSMKNNRAGNRKDKVARVFLLFFVKRWRIWIASWIWWAMLSKNASLPGEKPRENWFVYHNKGLALIAPLKDSALTTGLVHVTKKKKKRYSINSYLIVKVWQGRRKKNKIKSRRKKKAVQTIKPQTTKLTSNVKNNKYFHWQMNARTSGLPYKKWDEMALIGSRLSVILKSALQDSYQRNRSVVNLSNY